MLPQHPQRVQASEAGRKPYSNAPYTVIASAAVFDSRAAASGLWGKGKVFQALKPLVEMAAFGAYAMETDPCHPSYQMVWA